MNISDKFIDYLYNLSFNSLEDRLEKAVRRCFLDYLGATIAGAKILGERGKLLIENMGKGNDCTIIGFKTKGTLHTASFVNGFSSHTAELDDGVISGIIHPGAPIFTALISAAEKYKSSFEKFILGAFIGYEASVRLANAIQPKHKLLGYHASGTCGLIGAAVAVGIMTGQSKKQLKNTLSAAVASVHGTLKVLEDSSELKPFNIASAASDALVAAIVSEVGFAGPDDPLGGYSGFFSQNVNGEVDYDKLFKTEGQPFAIENVYVKPYAACRYCHPSIENALFLRTKLDKAEDIDSIIVKTYDLAVNKHDMTSVDNVSAAKMSIPFAIAVTILKGSASVDSYTPESVQDKKIMELMKKITVLSDDVFSKAFPELSIATMDIKLKNGSQIHSRINAPKGEANLPLTDKELLQKFVSLAEFGGINVSAADSLGQEILNKKNLTIPYILQILS